MTAALMDSLFPRWRKRMRRTLKRLPYPDLWARIAGTRVPDEYIAGRAAGLNRPESVTFSPSGKIMAVANSKGSELTFYPALDGCGFRYAGIPTGRFKHPGLLHYAHDAAFLATDRWLVAVGEYANALSTLELAMGDAGRVECRLAESFAGQDRGLNHPAGIAVHPSGEWLAVANRVETGITAYANVGRLGRISPEPCQMVSEGDLNALGLAAPHGLDFSPDGRYMFVTHKRYAGLQDSKGASALSVFECRSPPAAGFLERPVCLHPYGESALHFVACHPGRDAVGVTNSLGDLDLLRWNSALAKMEKESSIPVFRVGEGVKGISFTRDGNRIAITSELDEVLFFDHALT